MSNDYAKEAVPISERKSWISISFIWIAVGIDLSAMIFGAELGNGMSFKDALLAVVIGSSLLGVLAAICAYVGQVTGLSTSMISKLTFGNIGTKLVSLLVAISLIGWFGVQAGFFAENAKAAVAGALGWNIPVPLLALIGGVLMTATAVIGYKAIEKLSSWSVPLLLILVVLAVIMAIRKFGAAGLSAPVENSYTFGMAVSLVISIFVVGATISPDISRWAKTKKDAVLAAFFGFFFGNSFMVVIAIILSRVMNESDLTTIMLIVGLGVPGILVLILAQWTTNTSNAYSSGLSLSVVFDKLDKRKLTMVAGGIGTLLAVFGIYDYFVNFLTVVTMFISPIAGVYTATYYVGGPKKFINSMEKNVKVLPLIAWALGTIVSWFTTAAPFGLGLFNITTVPSIDGFIAAFVFQVIFILVTRREEK